MRRRAALGLAVVGLLVPTAGCASGETEASGTPSASKEAASSAATTPVDDQGSGTDATDVLTLTGPETPEGRCVPPTAENLRELAATALSGEVTAVRDEVVTIAPDRWYAGEPAPTVEVTAPAATLRSLVQAVELREGERYLVAVGQDDQVLLCGFSTADTAQARRLYAQAFGS